jgi:hypothetical protein
MLSRFAAGAIQRVLRRKGLQAGKRAHDPADLFPLELRDSGCQASFSGRRGTANGYDHAWQRQARVAPLRTQGIRLAGDWLHWSSRG